MFRFDLDYFTVTSESTNLGTRTIAAELGPDGTDDFIQELAALGAQGNQSAPGASTVVGAGGAVGANRIFFRWVTDAIAREIYRIYDIDPQGTPRDAIAFTIHRSGDPGAPAPATFDPEGDFSMMRFGGTMDGFLGRSWISPYYAERIDDTSNQTGVATAAILNALVATPGLTDAFAPTKPDTGTPVGEAEEDAHVLAAGFDPYAEHTLPRHRQRYDDLRRIARFIGLAVASVAAHEMGHAMGLIPDGPPPAGFFGGRPDVNFMGSDRTNSHHADYPGLNLMQAGGNPVAIFTEALDSMELPRGTGMVEIAEVFAMELRLSPYAKAYLAGRLTHGAGGPVGIGPFGCRDGVCGQWVACGR